MTGADLHARLADRKARGRLLGQPGDLQTAYVTTRGGFTSRKTIEAAAGVISRGGHLSDYASISPLFGFAGQLPEVENASA